MSDSHHYLFYATYSYAFGVLRPIESELRRRGHEVAWFVPAGDEAEHFLGTDDRRLPDVASVIQWRPDAVLTSGNYIPHFFPGIKVQLFHGIDSGKQGEADIRGFFDLYCTQAPSKTAPFAEIHRRNKSFDYVETGWAKLDPLFTPQVDAERWRTPEPLILFAPTFSPSMTCTWALYNEIARLVAEMPWQWRVKFHPKVSDAEVEAYRKLEGDRLRIVDTPDVVPLLQAADVMLSDTSSIVTEFALLGKPVVTFRNLQPRDWMLHFTEPERLQAMLESGLHPDPDLLQKIRDYADEIHPLKDGRSAGRTVDAIEAMIAKGTAHLAHKPLNLWRKWRMRHKLGYFRLG